MARSYGQSLGVPAPPLDAQALSTTGGNLTFFALALHPNGTTVSWPQAGLRACLQGLPAGPERAHPRPPPPPLPPQQVPVMHSDLAFNLLYQDAPLNQSFALCRPCSSTSRTGC